MRYVSSLLVCTVLALAGSTCLQTQPNPQPQPKARTSAALRGFSSPDELRQYLADQAAAQSGGTRGGGVLYETFALTPQASVPAANQGQATGGETPVADTSGAGATSTDPFSTTNVQEEGVDESDVVKNDGQTVFALDGKKVHVVKASPADQVAELATIALEVEADSLYLKGSVLAAISRQHGFYYYGDLVPLAVKEQGVFVSGGGTAGSPGVVDPAAPIGSPIAQPPISTTPQTIVSIFDVSDPGHPAKMATLKLDGILADSRLIGSKLHLVVQMTPILPANPTPEALRNQDLSTWIPNFEIDGPGGAMIAPATWSGGSMCSGRSIRTGMASSRW